MTPAQLLERTKRHFTILMHKEDDALQALCVTAIREYQDRAGFIAELLISEKEQKTGGVPLPPDWSSLLSAKDARAVYVSTDIYDREMQDKPSVKHINVKPDVLNIAPYRVGYVQDIASTLEQEPTAFQTIELPTSVIGIIQKYLKVLIAIPNNERLRQTYRAMEHPAFEQITPDEVLESQKIAIELEMDEAQDFLPPLMIM